MMTVTEKLFLLKSAPGFRQLHDAEQAVIAEIAYERHFQPGEVICLTGTTLNQMYVLIKGSMVDCGLQNRFELLCLESIGYKYWSLS